MSKIEVSDSLIISYEQSEKDLPVLTIGRTSAEKIKIIRILGGESASNLYDMILNYGNNSDIINSRMMRDHNNCTMLMPKDNGRSMIKRNIAEMFNTEIKIGRGNGKSSQDLDNLIERGEIK
jgi:hypothetical protein